MLEQAWVRLLYAIAMCALMTACASLPPQSGRVSSHAIEPTSDTRLGQTVLASEAAHPGDNAFHLLPDGMDALVARVLLSETADRSLDLQYYIWHDDLTGRAMAASMLRAADRGVRVRLLLDDLGTNADDDLLLALASHPNVQVRLFNPVANRSFKRLGSAVEFFRVNRRMHNKSFIADNQVAILGGRNIGDEYFGASSTISFGDLDVFVHGPVVRQVSDAFDLYWNSDAAYPIQSLVGRHADAHALASYREALDAYLLSEAHSPYVAQTRQRIAQVIESRDASFVWGKAILLYDDPAKITRATDDSEGRLISKFRALKLQPEHELLIVSPYFVPREVGVQWLRSMTARGVRVTVLTNSLAATDVSAVHAGYQRYRKDMLEAGVRLYELKPVASGDGKDENKEKKSMFGSSKASLHAKTYVFDRERIFIGSMNLDPRSVELNTEIGVYCESAAAAREVADGIGMKIDRIAWRVELQANGDGSQHMVWIDTDADGTTKTLEHEPDVSSFKRATIWMLGILPIESQL
ncbi:MULTISPECIES: phospholipase D family protein [unclassified Caballeronia]|uniref:phospholipase D family protein n=1 Tax=unclassified Caballeronia TaxID=2646786 RepID=UPI00285646D1|nr:MULTISPECIES: phospholipase D family protein [unclassified Caballeronia]MDR5740446.1 phospholipase D family protein [Caballeronia sp. LZ016]MDR5809033.1 phospholipase D family protein [Caballeronia sp. LZ019]